MRVGDPAGLNVDNTPSGTTLSVHFDYVDRSTGAVWLSRPLPSTGARPCTLSHAEGALGASSLTYWLETEGLPSLSNASDTVVLPCHALPAGSRFGSLISSLKTIGILSRDGSTTTTAPFFGFKGVRGSTTGLRQAVTVNSQEFWLGGIANQHYGVRYLASRTSNATARVHGSYWYPQETPPRYMAGTLDLRGLTLFGSQVFATSSYIAEPNRNMDVPNFTPWGGVVRIGERGVLERNVTRGGSLLRGFDGRRNFGSLVFEHGQSLWLLEDVGRYSRASAAAGAEADRAALSDEDRQAQSAGAPAASSYNRVWLQRTSVGTAIVNWVWRNGATAGGNGAWVEVTTTKTYLPGGTPGLPGREAAYSLAGRTEALAGGVQAWIVYATTRSRLFRVHPALKKVETLRMAPTGTIFRGVALPPYRDPSPSRAVTSSRTKTPPATKSKTRKAKAA